MADEILNLNANWRVADDPPQWALQCRESKATGKSDGWRSRKFIRGRDHLLARISELCGKVDPAALETIRLWPNSYVTWKAVEMKAPAGPDTDPRSAIWSLGDGGSPQDDDVSLAPAEAA